VDGQFDRGIIHSNVVVVYKLGIHWYSIDPLNVIFPLRQGLDPMSSHLVFLQNLSYPSKGQHTVHIKVRAENYIFIFSFVTSVLTVPKQGQSLLTHYINFTSLNCSIFDTICHFTVREIIDPCTVDILNIVMSFFEE